MESGAGVTAFLAMIGTGVAAMVSLWFVARRRRAHIRLRQLEDRVRDRLAAERLLDAHRVIAVAHMRGWRGPADLDLAGTIPSRAHGEAVIDIAEREAARAGVPVRIRNRLSIQRRAA